MNKVKVENHMIISIHAEKASDKIQHAFMTKTLSNVRTEGTLLNIERPHMTKSPPASYSTGKNYKCSP